MTAKEAYALLNSKWPEFEVVSCYETKTLFIFQTFPQGYEGNPSKLMDNLCSVNKNTGLVKTFQPFHISSLEYKNGKKVSNFK